MKFYNELLRKLKDKEPFKFSRWGDGEWLCMQGEEGKNRDGNAYLPELGKELTRILESRPDYYLGIQYGVFYNEKYVYGHSHPSLREFMIDHLFRLDIDYVNGDILHQASEFRYLQEFIDILKERETIIIGADYFKEVPWADHIEIPAKDSFLSNKEIFRRINFDEMEYDREPVFLVAAAMNSNVIIDWMPRVVTAIDIGSVLDPYLGRPRATYQHKLFGQMKLQKLW